MLTCIALDDEPIALEIIKMHCSKLPFINLSKTFTQPSKVTKYLQKFPIDLIFLDINMPDINGINFYKNLQQEVMVIFTTAYSEYAIDGFQVNAVDYLLKPIEFDRFRTACEKVRDYADYLKSKYSKQQTNLVVRSEYALVKIPFAEILYLEKIADYIKIHRKNKEAIFTLMSMKKMLDKLPKDNFIRVHRSFTINQNEVKGIRGKQLFIDGKAIPIGKTYTLDFINPNEK